ncbi:MAG: hypothetical protein K9H25_23715 [Rhodospirillum sp.]|nr:hypothetical protein [Rhodospirillum sp.]MCF8492134.1 hypothetical protein [Rhodospirillum sp.]MCF8501051.1 hypothetical protein [Rhodospirillum sp.]
MNRVHVIGFVGTGQAKGIPYSETVYCPMGEDGGVRRDLGVRSRYPSHALARIHGADRLTLLVTDEAEKVQTLWENRSDPFPADLRRAVAWGNEGHPDLKPVPAPRFETIGAGRTMSDQWTLFDTLVRISTAAVDAEDTLVLDISLGFRSVPFFAGTVSTYLRAAGHKGPIKVFYGAWEARQDVEGDTVTPLWDLTETIRLGEVSLAIRVLMETGRMPSSLLEPLRETRGFAALAEALERYNRDFETVNLPALLLGRAATGETPATLVRRLLSSMEAPTGARAPLAHVLRTLEATMNHLSTDESNLTGMAAQRAALGLAERYLAVGRLIEAAITLDEMWPLLYADEDQDQLPFAGEGAPPSKRRVHRVQSRCEERWRAESGPQAKRSGKVRNSFAHGGIQISRREEVDLTQEVGSLLDGYREAIARGRPAVAPVADGSRPGKTPELGPFLNVTNHPSTTWKEDQRSGAEEIGPIVDWPFPRVEEDLTTRDILDLARDEVARIVRLNPRAVLVQGEFVLTACLIPLLQKEGIPVYATVTRRAAETGGFQFLGYRLYPVLTLSEDPV